MSVFLLTTDLWRQHFQKGARRDTVSSVCQHHIKPTFPIVFFWGRKAFRSGSIRSRVAVRWPVRVAISAQWCFLFARKLVHPRRLAEVPLENIPGCSAGILGVSDLKENELHYLCIISVHFMLWYDQNKFWKHLHSKAKIISFSTMRHRAIVWCRYQNDRDNRCRICWNCL